MAYCLAHARRQFFEVYQKSQSSVAAEALQRIAMVYQIEERVRGRTAAERGIVRQAETKPILEAFKIWLMQRLAEKSAKSDLAKAIKYTLNHWNGLTVFLTDGRVEIDSNIVERTIRPIALGRRNALFAGQHVEQRRGRSWLPSSTRRNCTNSIHKPTWSMCSRRSCRVRPK